MTVFLNGNFVPEAEAVISVFDRSFLYGDGLFEAIRVYDGEPFLWDDHLARLRYGLELMRLANPCSAKELREAALALVIRNEMPNCILRILISRGVGERGFSPRTARSPTIVISTHPAPLPCSQPPLWKAIISTLVLPADDPLARFKSCNRLRQVLARTEADDAGANEALLLNSKGFVVEGTTTNLFWVEGDTVCTPKPDAGILPGTTRAYLLRLGAKLGIKCEEREIRREELLKADGLFVTSCSAEVTELVELDGQALRRSGIPAVFHKNYRSAIAAGLGKTK